MTADALAAVTASILGTDLVELAEFQDVLAFGCKARVSITNFAELSSGALDHAVCVLPLGLAATFQSDYEEPS